MDIPSDSELAKMTALELNILARTLSIPFKEGKHVMSKLKIERDGSPEAILRDGEHVIPGFVHYALRFVGEQPVVFNVHTRATMHSEPDSYGYQKLTLRNNNGDHPKGYFLHRLTILTMTGPPPNASYTVHHKDGNRLNNSVANLAWASPHEQRVAQPNAVRRGAEYSAALMARPADGGEPRHFNSMAHAWEKLCKDTVKWETFKNNVNHGIKQERMRYGHYWIRVVDSDAEEWALVPVEYACGFSNVYASKSGKIKLPKGRITCGHQAGNYYKVNLGGGLQRRSCCVHRLVAGAWIADGRAHNKQVDHIDRNGFNNHVDNLRWATRKENMANRMVENRVAVEMLDFAELQNGNIVVLSSFDSMSKAKESINGAHLRAIQEAVNGHTDQAYGYAWRHADQSLRKEADRVRAERHAKPRKIYGAAIYSVDNVTGEQRKYENRVLAARDLAPNDCKRVAKQIGEARRAGKSYKGRRWYWQTDRQVTQ